MTTRIILADDHPVVSLGARAVLESDGLTSVVATATSPEELLHVLTTTPCDAVVTDYIMPSARAMDGMGLLGQLQRRWPYMPVLVMTALSNPAILQYIHASGVRALVHKSDVHGELSYAVRAVLRGKIYLSQCVREQINGDVMSDTPMQPGKMLSPREAEVLRLFASGRTVSDIAGQLHRSVKTVSGQKNRAMTKLGLRSDVDIYTYARESGLLA
ncbi:response regulator transcription factor [Dyella sp. ASV21]|uniref:response regulator transcription factor n=1 Tax=Dyella sp. ASV21 TaxID=2795114 RepID=UPI0018ED2E45|nr:response regulator transcription factor [Dyella sp. ASV21]